MMYLLSTDQLKKKVIINVVSVQGYIINVFILFKLIINNKSVLACFIYIFF